jgi:hypothetical protein
MPTTLETNSLQNPNVQASGSDVTPYSIIDGHIKDLTTTFKSVVRGLQQQKLDARSYNQELGRHQDSYDQKISSILAVKNQLDVINKLMTTGQLDQNSGTQAMWKAVLPEDVANAMFPHTRKEDSFNQVQMKQLTGYVKPDGTSALCIVQK